MKAAILGATGYTGQILLRLLGTHPHIQAIYPVSSSQVGKSLFENDPGLNPGLVSRLPRGPKLLEVQEAVAEGVDVVFAALPHLKSAEVCDPFFGKAVVIDLSADFRIKDHGLFTAAYGVAPPRPELLQMAIYGLSEWQEAAIARASLIANPGCYPTATLLPLLPLSRAGLLEGPVIVNALSGVSGAGRKLADTYLFCGRSENMNAYSPGKTHRHQTEIQDQLDTLGQPTDSQNPESKGQKSPVRQNELFFTPHLIPVRQGMTVTTTCQVRAGTTATQIAEQMDLAYHGCPWINLCSTIPQSSQVRGTNRCDISWHLEGQRIFLFSAIDNLLKGASGQAVQNMNIRFGFDQQAGLPTMGELP